MGCNATQRFEGMGILVISSAEGLMSSTFLSERLVSISREIPGVRHALNAVFYTFTQLVLVIPRQPHNEKEASQLTLDHNGFLGFAIF